MLGVTVGKYFNQAFEIDRLRKENARLLKINAELNALLGGAGIDNPYGVTPDELTLATSGRKIEAIKAYRARTGADLLSAKNAIDAVV
ncbi:50S ribosomal protein L7/L12 [Trueperella pecoris]|uniref:50S ribosomal protein L7/L12 n=1 Tax=Trueperella pecoris TaxID=2733571 RepID=A0A7M1QZU7_9ACTO|nr:hypothetical protein [Trueperella pecoris]QOR47351.1 50S ribosomal protein L7/L12 [Trueperella pecoris]